MGGSSASLHSSRPGGYGAGIRSRAKGLGCRVQGVGCRVKGEGCRVKGAGCRVKIKGCRMKGVRFGVKGSWGLGSRV